MSLQDAPLSIQAIEVFTDTTGIYRTFEQSSASLAGTSAGQANGAGVRGPNSTSHAPGPSRQTTEQQIQRLQEEKPAISAHVQSADEAVHSTKGTQMLAVLMTDGELQVRSVDAIPF